LATHQVCSCRLVRDVAWRPKRGVGARDRPDPRWCAAGPLRRGRRTRPIGSPFEKAPPVR